MFKELFKYRDLLLMLTLRDIRIRYKQAIMGFLWAIFMPVLAIMAGVLIKKAMSVVSGKPIDLAGVVSISVKVLPWTFFVSAIKFSVNSLVGNRNLVTKIYFPREVLPISSILACLFDFLVGLITLSILLAIVRVGISVNILFVPLIFIFLILFTTGICLFLASANLFYRDVKYVVEIILMFGIFFTPVFYEASMVGKWQVFLLLNPIGSMLEALSSSVVLHKAPDMFWFSYAAVTSIVIFLVGFLAFHKTEPYFAENI